MKCSELQFNLSLYTDGALSESESASIKVHLEICPLCRQKNSEFRELRSGLERLGRPEIPQSLQDNLKVAFRKELRTRREASVPVRHDPRGRRPPLEIHWSRRASFPISDAERQTLGVGLSTDTSHVPGPSGCLW